MENKKFVNRQNFFRKSKDKQSGTAISFFPYKNRLGLKIASIISGQDKFNWDESLFMSLNSLELAQLIRLIDNPNIGEVKIYHSKDPKVGKEYSALNIRWLDKGLSFNINRSDSKKNYFLFSKDEVVILRIAFEEIIRLSLGWGSEDKY